MTEEIKSLVQEYVNDTSGKWMQINDIERMVEDILRECIRIIEDCPTTCAFTTHDLGTVQCTIDKAAEQVRKKFGLKQYYGVLK